MHPIITYMRRELKKAADPEKAAPMQAYMKTEQKFYGVQAGPRRAIFRRAKKTHPINSRDEYFDVILELWSGDYREEMYLALDVAESIKKYRDEKSWPLYVKLMKTATNWDTLDVIAGKLLCALVLENRKYEKELKKWRTSKNFWVRRASILAQFHRKETNTELLEETILMLAHEKEFFIRKAIGWVLRDYSYNNPDWVEAFVAKHADKLSGLSKREALKAIRRRVK